MRPQVLAIRAISSRYAKQAMYPVFILISAILTVLAITTGLLAYYFTDWWWLATILTILAGLAVLVVWCLVHITLKTIAPNLNPEQLKATDNFVGKLKRLLENATTPYPILAIRIAFDVVLRRKPSLVSETINDSSGLRKEFSNLTKLFR